jgi:tRNA pseudouridine38-40 synthase
MERVRIKLVVAYDGSNYAGWQLQKTGTGVQEVVEAALGKLLQLPVRLHSSSRTDTGVHALGMVAHFDIEKNRLNVPPEKLALALNFFLPEDVRIFSATRAAADFHARFDATGKQYRYYVWNATAMNPLLRTQAWHVPKPLDVAAMRAASGSFLGRRDFKSFAANRNYEMESTVRTLWRCDVKKAGPLLTFVIEGDGFLYKMCRGIAGTLVQLGLGKIGPEALPAILAGKDRRLAGMTAPAHGLVLVKVYFKSRKNRDSSKLRAARKAAGTPDETETVT